MEFRNLVKVALAAAAFITSGMAMAGGPDMVPPPPMDPTQDAIHAYVSASAYFGDDTRILRGFENDNNVSLSTNLDHDGSDTSFVPELGLWFPLWSNHENMIVNFVTFVNWIPGSKVTSSGIDGQGDTFKASLHHYMFNIGVGVNFLHYFAHRLFGLVMLGGGANYIDYHADFESVDTATELDRSTGTASIYRPFVTVKLGIGANLSDKSQVLVFGRYTSVESRILSVSDNIEESDTSSVVISAPNCWWEVGIQFTRSFSL